MDNENINSDIECPRKRIKLGKTDDLNTKQNKDWTDEMELTYDDDVTDMGNEFKIPGDKCSNYVTLDEIDKLREFQVLDEIKSNEEESDADESDSEDVSEGEVVPDDEIEKMLEEDLPENFKAAPKPKEKTYVKRQKIMLEEKGVNNFEVLPLDWVSLRHCSGIPVYLHRSTRVCTLSKPYFIGKLNTKRHEIPLSAIPCLAYRKALEEEEQQKIIDQQIQEQIEAIDKKKNACKSPGNNFNENKINRFQTPVGNSEKINPVKADSLKVYPKFDDSKNDESIETDLCKDSTSHEKSDSNVLNESVQDVSSDINQSTGIKNDEKQNVSSPRCPITHINNLDINSKSDNNSDENGINKANSNTDEMSEKTLNDKPDESGNKPVRQPLVLPGGIVMPPPRVETVNVHHLTPEQVTNYCKKLYKFKTVNIMHFKRWADRRKYTKARRKLQRPTLPEGAKLITIPAQNANGNNKTSKRDWVMNMSGHCYLSVFHEYVWRAFQKQPVYEFKQLENASSPYQATVFIGGMQYGVGRGTSKRLAKAAAAKASIGILIPEMRDALEPTRTDAEASEPDLSFFDNIGIEDPRIMEFCAATCEPSPHAILRTCLLRNFGASDRHIHTEMKKLEYQEIELTMKVGKHSATVVCKNKKLAKQRASQAILQQLHPHIQCWGSLLRLYGTSSVKSCKEKKLELQQITLLQDKARHNEPNYAVLKKLRNEMIKLRERDEAVVPIGTLLVKDDLPKHSGSNLNNVDL